MSAPMQTPETRAIVIKLAKEYKLMISRFLGEQDVEGWYFAKPKINLILFYKAYQKLNMVLPTYWYFM
jgi:hypothetical protein